MTRALLVATALAAASPAAAQVLQDRGGPSPRWGSVDISLGPYRPRIDSDYPKGQGPYEKTFGKGNGLLFTVGVSKSLFTRFGTLDAGVRTGYFGQSAKGFVLDGSVPPGSPPDMLYSLRAGGNTSFRFIPTSAVLTYRFDWPVERWHVPFAPYGRVAFERYNWWITKGTGGTVEKGATQGWSATAGLAFLLDVADPQLAREFDHDSGVNHTYVFFEVTTARVDDFGSSKSWDLGPENFDFAAGLTFVF